MSGRTTDPATRPQARSPRSSSRRGWRGGRGVVRVGERIHVIGIAGSGAAGAAVLLRHAGANVDGCDIDAPSPYTPAL
ncbi:MAG: Mur ligase domain-containing protein, partial [Candidatus Limnocylindria bacterium]